MLSADLQTVQQQLDNISQLVTVATAVARDVSDDILTAGIEMLPGLSGAQAQLVAFAASSTQTLITLKAVAAQASGTDQAVQALHDLGQGFSGQRAGFGEQVRNVATFRDTVGDGMARLAAEQVRLNTALAAAGAQHDQLTDAVGAVRPHASATDMLSTFLPLLRTAGDSTAMTGSSLSTEQALAVTKTKVADLSLQAQTLRAAGVACSVLGISLGGLQTTTQNVANAISLVSSDLTNDAVRAAAASPVTLTLFLGSLITAIGVLQDGAS